MSFLKKIKKEITVASDQAFGDVNGFIDSGSFMLNALLSGSIYNGIAKNKIIALAGSTSTGKTYFALGIVSAFLSDNPKGEVIYFDTEYAITNEMLTTRNIDLSRFAFVGNKEDPESIVDTVEKFRDKCFQYLDSYMKIPENERTPLLIVLDSLGMLSTNKELKDVSEKSEKSDMGAKAKLIKSIFTVLTLKSGIANVPIIFTNHTYNTIGSMYPTTEMGGGCLVANTQIQIENGVKNIQDLKIGDKVKTLFGMRDVTNLFEFKDKELYRIEFEDGTIVECSGDHKFMIDNGDGYEWVFAKDLVSGIGLVEVD
jgi:RecA/RadA recombinase